MAIKGVDENLKKGNREFASSVLYFDIFLQRDIDGNLTTKLCDKHDDFIRDDRLSVRLSARDHLAGAYYLSHGHILFAHTSHTECLWVKNLQ